MISSNNGKAIYMVIADKIIDDIISGKLAEGERLLSIRDYAVEVQVNHNTVKRTYDYLSDRGLIFNRRGIGFYVAENARSIGERLRSSQLLGNELDKIFRQLHLLGIKPDELAERYGKFIDSQIEENQQ